MAQFADMNSKFQRLDEVVQQAMDTLNDVKSRQNTAGRVLDKLDHQGPLIGMMSRSNHVTAADVKCRVAQTVISRRQRSKTSKDQQLIAGIEHAQDVACAQRGRSVERWVEAAQ